MLSIISGRWHGKVWFYKWVLLSRVLQGELDWDDPIWVVYPNKREVTTPRKWLGLDS